jgi:hypothetical protein
LRGALAANAFVFSITVAAVARRLIRGKEGGKRELESESEGKGREARERGKGARENKREARGK